MNKIIEIKIKGFKPLIKKATVGGKNQLQKKFKHIQFYMIGR